MTEDDKRKLLNLDPRWNLPSKLQPSGEFEQGDTCANAFTLLYVDPLALPRHTALQLLTSDDGWPRRSPDSYKWYGRPGRCSRDQLTPALLFTAVYAQAAFRGYFLACAKHLFCLANNWKPNWRYDTPAEHAERSTPDVPFEPQRKLPDVLFMDMWAVFVRGLLLQPYGKLLLPVLYPLLLIFDLQNLLALPLQQHSQDHDARNLTLKIHFAAHHYRTPLSMLTWRLYKAMKPQKWHSSFWQQPGEPRLDLWVNRLFED